MPRRPNPPVAYPKSKAIATITTALSAIIFKLPDGIYKEILLVMVGLLAYFVYHVFVLVKRFALSEMAHWLSLAFAERKVYRYIRELTIEYHAPDTSPERLAEIKCEMKRYRDQLAQKRFENLSR